MGISDYIDTFYNYPIYKVNVADVVTAPILPSACIIGFDANAFGDLLLNRTIQGSKHLQSPTCLPFTAIKK